MSALNLSGTDRSPECRAETKRLIRKLFCLAGMACMPAWAASGAQIADAQQSGLRAPDGSGVSSHSVAALSPELRGDICMARKMYRDAIDFYRRAPQSPSIYNKTGIAFQQLMRADLAKQSYEQALKLNPGYADASNNLGTVYYSEHSYRKAVGYYKRSLKASGPNALVYSNLGAAYFARHNYKTASEYYERALNLDPDILERRGTSGPRVQEQAASDLASFHLYLAKAYAKRGANERALLYLRRALEEGITDRKKVSEAPEFSSLKKDREFLQLLAENPRPL